MFLNPSISRPDGLFSPDNLYTDAGLKRLRLVAFCYRGGIGARVYCLP